MVSLYVPGDHVAAYLFLVQVVEQEAETPDTWSSIAVGLAELCAGLGGAVDGEHCSMEDVSAVFEEDSLLLLYEASPSTHAR